MELTSPIFKQGEKIPKKYTCDGDNINPPLEIRNVPDGAGSLALIMEDPDVPQNLRKDGMWDHWVVFNMPPNLKSIKEHEEPDGLRGVGTDGFPGYSGPCPPDREHRYFFKLFALDEKLNLPPNCAKNDVLDAMEGHIIERTELMGRYDRT